MTGEPAPASGAPTEDVVRSRDPLALRREDLAVLVEACQREKRSWRQWIWVALGIGGLLAAESLIVVGEYLGWSASLSPIFFFGGWAVMLAAGAELWRRSRSLRRRYRFECPTCHAELLDGLRGPRAMARAEVVIATGTCTHCGTTILSP